MAELPPLSEAIEKIKKTLPEHRKDGLPRRIRLTSREEGLVMVLLNLIEHVSTRDGIGNTSLLVCRGCNHDRRVPCPMAPMHKLLEEIGPAMWTYPWSPT